MSLSREEKNTYIQGLFAIVTAAGWDCDIKGIHVAGLKEAEGGGQPDLVVIEVEDFETKEDAIDHLRDEVIRNKVFAYTITMGDCRIRDGNDPEIIVEENARTIVAYDRDEGMVMMLTHIQALDLKNKSTELDTDYGQNNFMGKVEPIKKQEDHYSPWNVFKDGASRSSTDREQLIQSILRKH